MAAEESTTTHSVSRPFLAGLGDLAVGEGACLYLSILPAARGDVEEKPGTRAFGAAKVHDAAASNQSGRDASISAGALSAASIAVHGVVWKEYGAASPASSSRLAFL